MGVMEVGSLHKTTLTIKHVTHEALRTRSGTQELPHKWYLTVLQMQALGQREVHRVKAHASF